MTFLIMSRCHGHGRVASPGGRAASPGTNPRGSVTAVAPSSAAVAIVGAGPVAQALGRLLVAGGTPVVAIASRTQAHAEQAAVFLNTPAGQDESLPVEPVRVVAVADVPAVASRVLIAVSDSGIEPIAEALAAAGMQSGLALHTCGAKGPSALRALASSGVACGMLHPLQTIVTAQQGAASLAGITFAVAGDGAAIEWGEQLVAAMHARALRIDAARLGHYHAGAVMASNAVIAVLDAAAVLLAAAGIDRERALPAIAPLARTSVANAVASGPQAALTGPVVRGDAATIAIHMRALEDVDPTVARLYEAAAAHLLQLAGQRGLPADRVRAVQVAIDGTAG